jgi:hypothetical protein
MGNFFAELKRRHVYRVGAAYVLAAWPLTNAIVILAQVFILPSWIAQTAIALSVVGFPVVLITAWMIESKPHEAIGSMIRSKSTMVDWTLCGMLAVVMLFIGYEQTAAWPELFTSPKLAATPNILLVTTALALAAITGMTVFFLARSHTPNAHDAWRKRLKDGQRMRTKPILYRYLEDEIDRYGCPPYPKCTSRMMIEKFTIDGKPFTIQIPVTVLSGANSISLGRINEALDPKEPVRGKWQPNEDDDEHLKHRYEDNKLRHPIGYEKSFFNGPLFTIQDLDVSKPEISGSLSTYFSTLVHTDVIEFELLDALSKLDEDARPPFNIERHLPKRTQFLKRSPAEQKRHATIGISVLLALKEKEKHTYSVLLRHRSDNVALFPGLFNVIPSCVFQPESYYHIKKEWDLEYCIIKEYCEELFSMERNGTDHPSKLYDWVPAKNLRSALDDKTCKILYSGVILNLLNMRPQVCCVLLIDAAWFKKQEKDPDFPLRISWEYATTTDDLKEGKSAWVDRDRIPGLFATKFATQMFDELAAAESVGIWVPDALAALWLGMRAISRDNPHVALPCS